MMFLYERKIALQAGSDHQHYIENYVKSPGQSYAQQNHDNCLIASRGIKL